MSAITTHVLDTSRGAPAGGVHVTLEHIEGDGWRHVGEGETDSDGRLRTLMAPNAAIAPGIYRLVFQTKRYFAAQRVTTLYPEVVIVFETTDGNPHYHVPLLVSPYGYSTYRGS